MSIQRVWPGWLPLTEAQAFPHTVWGQNSTVVSPGMEISRSQEENEAELELKSVPGLLRSFTSVKGNSRKFDLVLLIR